MRRDPQGFLEANHTESSIEFRVIKVEDCLLHVAQRLTKHSEFFLCFA